MRHLRLDDYADYTPNSISWLLGTLHLYEWDIRKDKEGYTCTIWKPEWITNSLYDSIILPHGHSKDLCGAVREAHHFLMDYLDETGD